MKKRIWIGAGLLILFCSGCGEASRTYFETARETEAAEADTEEIMPEHVYETETAAEGYVYRCGAVAAPGVYKLPAKSRIYEAVLLAGGLLEDACEDSVNQAEEVADGQMIRILTKAEAEEEKALSQNDAQPSDGRINLNTADEQELMSLPGIGASKAQSILAYREEKGGFSSTEDIMNITGIKEGVYAKIKDCITVD